MAGSRSWEPTSGLGKGYCDFAGSGVVHAVGGITALAVALIIGPRIGKFNRDGSSNAIIGHDISAVLIGCFILAFGWFGFNPGSTLGASGAGYLRIGSIAVNTMLAGCTGTFGALLYMWALKGKPDASMSGNGLLAGLVAITAPSGFVNTVGAAIIGLIAGVLVCLSVRLRRERHEGRRSSRCHLGPRHLRTVGRTLRRSVCRRHQQLRRILERCHRLCHRPLLRWRRSQLVAQLVGISTLVGFVFTFSFVLNWVLDFFLGQRVSAETEIAGLDLPEMGQLGYPEFVFAPEPDFLVHAERGYAVA